MADAMAPAAAAAGVLVVRLERAFDLKSMDLFKHMDPYCVLTLGKVKMLSNVHKRGGVMPVWHETFRFSFGNSEQTLDIKIKDKDRLLADDFVGRATLDLHRARQLRGHRVMLPVLRKSGKQRGSLELVVTFTPSPDYSDRLQRDQTSAAAGAGAATGLLVAAQAPLQPQQPQQQGLSSPPSAAAAAHYPAVTPPSACAAAPGWDSQTVASIATAAAYPRIGHSTYAHSEADSGDANSSHSGETAAAAAAAVTELVRCSVDFRSELQQLLGMLRVAEKEAADSNSWTERQIEEVAKEGGPASHAVIAQLGRQRAASEARQQQLQQRMATIAFSMDELSKLEALLSALQLQPEEASELQAGVMNRLMDVYHSRVQLLQLSEQQQQQQQQEAPEAQPGRMLPLPVSLVHQLRAAANNAAADGRAFGHKDWASVLADFKPLASASSQQFQHWQWTSPEGQQRLHDQQLQQQQQPQVLASVGAGPLQPPTPAASAGGSKVLDSSFQAYDLTQMMQVLQQAVEAEAGQQRQQTPQQQLQFPAAAKQPLLSGLAETSSLEEGMLAPSGQPWYLIADDDVSQSSLPQPSPAADKQQQQQQPSAFAAALQAAAAGAGAGALVGTGSAVAATASASGSAAAPAGAAAAAPAGDGVYVVAGGAVAPQPLEAAAAAGAASASQSKQQQQQEEPAAVTPAAAAQALRQAQPQAAPKAPPPPPPLPPTPQQQQEQAAGRPGPKPAPPPPPPPSGAKGAPPPPPPPLPPAGGKLGPADYKGPRPPPLVPGFKPHQQQPQSEFEKVHELIDTFRVLTGLAKGSTCVAAAAGAASAAADAAAAAGAGQQDAWKRELERKLGRKALIEQNYKERHSELLQWAAEIERCKAANLQELRAFVDSMERNLAGLVDDQAVLRLMGAEWPVKRYDDMLAAVKECQKLIDLRAGIDAWERPPAHSCQTVMGLLQRQFASVQWTLQQWDDQGLSLEKRCKAQGLPCPGSQLRDDVRKASLKLARAYVAEVLQEVEALALKQPPPKHLQQRQLQLLKDAAEFLYRGHQLTSGFDAATRQSYAAFACVLRRVQDGTYEPESAAALGARAALAGRDGMATVS